jgi:hypothetical protein
LLAKWQSTGSVFPAAVVVRYKTATSARRSRAAELGTAARVFAFLRCGRLAERWDVSELVGGRAWWLLGACEPFVRRSIWCYGGSVLCGPVPERLIGRSRPLIICSRRLNC